MLARIVDFQYLFDTNLCKHGANEVFTLYNLIWNKFFAKYT